MPLVSYQFNITWLNVIIARVSEWLYKLITFMSAFQDAPSNPQLCVLLEGFDKFPVDPYYEPLLWFMIIYKLHYQ